MKELEQLKQQLAEARETNQRLNRRCQQLESENAAFFREAKKSQNLYMVALRGEIERARAYANALRGDWRGEKKRIHEFYESHWRRLPKPDGLYDGIGARVDESLNQIEELKQNQYRFWRRD